MKEPEVLNLAFGIIRGSTQRPSLLLLSFDDLSHLMSVLNCPFSVRNASETSATPGGPPMNDSAAFDSWWDDDRLSQVWKFIMYNLMF